MSFDGKITPGRSLKNYLEVPSIFYNFPNFEVVKRHLLSYKTILLFLLLTQVFYASGQERYVIEVDGNPMKTIAEIDSLYRNLGPEKKDTLLFTERVLIAYNLDSTDLQSCDWVRLSKHSIGCNPASFILFIQTKVIKEFYLNDKLKRRRKGIPVSYFRCDNYFLSNKSLLAEAVRKNWRIGQEKLDQIEIIIPD